MTRPAHVALSDVVAGERVGGREREQRDSGQRANQLDLHGLSLVWRRRGSRLVGVAWSWWPSDRGCATHPGCRAATPTRVWAGRLGDCVGVGVGVGSE